MDLASLIVVVAAIAHQAPIVVCKDVPRLYFRAGLQAVASGPLASHDEKVTGSDSIQCVPLPSETVDGLYALQKSNCLKVQAAASELQPLAEWQFQGVKEKWQARVAKAKRMCKDSSEQVDHDARFAAEEAMEAWGSVLMQGRECCDSIYPPFCRTVDPMSRLGHIAPIAVSVFLVLAVFVAPYFCKRSVYAPSHALLDVYNESEEGPADACSPPVFPQHLPVLPLQMPAEWRLPMDLEALWRQKHSLRVLPNADQWAKSTATLFAALGFTFGFQEDSVRNQFEHILSLWRSQVSMVADRVYEGRTYQPGSNSGGVPAAAFDSLHQRLLSDSLAEVHGDLLRGMQDWRACCRECDAGGVPNEEILCASVPRMAGAPWAPLSADPVSSRSLPEVAVFLLVWAEAGNLRFMPELIYLITEFALASRQAVEGHIYHPLETGKSGAFLTHIVRPIYAVIFDENYKVVEVKKDDKGFWKDKQVLKDECQKFMPADCANYDDWNELFRDVPRLVETLVLKDGSKLFDLPHDERFHALPYVDWVTSLAGAKTHREVHSIWGVFVTTHRVWFIHLILYVLAVWWVSDPSNPSGKAQGQHAVTGDTGAVRLASACLVVPAFALSWKLARWYSAGVSSRRKKCNFSFPAIFFTIFGFLARLVFWSAPFLTYAAVRYISSHDYKNSILLVALGVHFLISAVDAYIILFFPGHSEDFIFPLTPVPLVSKEKFIRYLFWITVFAAKFLLGTLSISSLNSTVDGLAITQPGRTTPHQIAKFAFSPQFDKDMVKIGIMYGTSIMLFSTDTLFWVLFAATVLGLLIGLKQRSWRVVGLTFDDAVARIPERFSEKVLFYSGSSNPVQLGSAGTCSASFPRIWDRVVEYMRYEDKIDDLKVSDMLFDVTKTCSSIRYRDLQGRPSRAQRARVPLIFQEPLACTERCIRRDLGLLQDQNWKFGREVQWRLTALSRSLTLDMPRPFRAPFLPGITVLIPHYADSIHTTQKELYNQGDRAIYSEHIVPLMSWLSQRYEQEFEAFSVRMRSKYASASGGPGWPSAGTEWTAYNEEQWEQLCAWASMRSQTLWRTVAGMTLYHQVMDQHWQVQREEKTPLSDVQVWDPTELFSCIVSMQLYPYFDKDQLKYTNKMLEKFPTSLKIAFIDYEDFEVGSTEASRSRMHPKQQRRYYSCLIDKTCPSMSNGRRSPKLRIELPGFPILGDGKGDNQNHAIPFTRGSIIQCIDANQGAYFEQMLLLPCALAEFRSKKEESGNRRRATGGARRAVGEGMKRVIVGFPEHITSDFGSIGEFAAGAETAFGTLLQRSYAVLGARMHYGHPDMMNKTFMIQQGGVSKATKTVNLSEDIFAGMDFTLRGDGRTIKHAEYFHLAKGRDLGFNTVLTFFSKLSAGTGEQLLTRQVFRLGHVMGCPEFFAFYYAHGGFYITQYLLSRSVPLLVFVWLLCLLDDAEQDFSVMSPHFMGQGQSSAEVMAGWLSGLCSWVIMLFILASMAPLFAEVWLQQGICKATCRILKQILTLAPLHFIFQAKIIGIYISNEIRYGGASYLPTGRGLPTERQPFIKVPNDRNKEGGLYLAWAQNSFYDGFRLLLGTVLVAICGGMNVSQELHGALTFWCVCLAMTIISWLYAPFVFNPYQFAHRYFRKDLGDWYAVFLDDHGENWKSWYEKTQLKAESGMRGSVLDILGWAIFVTSWFTILQSKMNVLTMVTSKSVSLYAANTYDVVPPVLFSISACVIGRLILMKCCPRERHPHLAWFALAVCVADLAEVSVKLRKLIVIGWWKSFTAGLLLNYSTLSLMLFVAECTFRFKCGAPSGLILGFIASTLKLWLQAHRMAFDMIVSFFIFSTLAVVVLYDRVRSILCYSCSIHQLLVFRDPWGHLARAEANVGPDGRSDQQISLPRSFFNDEASTTVPSSTSTATGTTGPPPARPPLAHPPTVTPK